MTLSNAATKLFGERNTATNAVRALVAGLSDVSWLPGTAPELDPTAYAQLPKGSRREREAGIDAIFADAGPRSAWKHCATNFESAAPFEDTLVLFTVRHPASWLAGLFANPYHALVPLPGSPAAFVHMEWPTVARERLGGRSFTPLQLYNAKLSSYRAFSAKLEDAGIPFRFIRFEDVVLAQEQVFRALAADLGRADAEFRPLSRSTKDPERSLADYQRYYGEEQWRAKIAGSERVINDQVDWALAGRFGYSPL